MTDEIRFTKKKVDESWKDQVGKEKDNTPPPGTPSSKPKAVTSKSFVNLISSLGYQAMMNLDQGNMAEAKEIIDLLMAVQTKSAGNLSEEETQLFETLLPELQMKFAGKP